MTIQDNYQGNMDALSLTQRTNFFEVPVQLSPDSLLSLQQSDNITNVTEEEVDNSNVFLQIGRGDANDHGSINQSIAMNLIDVNNDTNCAPTDNSVNNHIPQNFELVSSQDASEINGVQWFEDDVDLTKIFLCNTEGDLEVDEFNLGFSENILFGNDDDQQQLPKLDKTGSSSTLDPTTCIELNNNYETNNSSLPQHKQNSATISDESNGNLSSSIVQDKSSLKRCDTSKTPFNCHYCCKSFRYSSRLKRHLTTHQNKQYPCRICHKLFSRVDVMEVHISRTHLKSYHKKKEMLTKTDSHVEGQNKKDNINSSSLNSSPLSSCDEEILQPEEKEQQLLKSSELTNYFSGTLAQLQDNDDNSINNDENTISNLGACTTNQLFRKKRQRSNLSLRCPKCPATLSSHHNLERHVNAHENQMGTFECRFCGKQFAIKHRYQMHLRIHVNERKFKCEECGLAFMQKEFLARHKLTHTGEVPFRCDTCGRAFRQLVNLKQHTIRKHFNNKNNKEQEEVISMKHCEYCHKCFMTTSELKNHLLYHLKERKHYCTLCSSKFLEKRHLDRHLRRIHSGIKNYICNVCGKGFYERYELNYHWKTSVSCCNSPINCSNNNSLNVTMSGLEPTVFA